MLLGGGLTSTPVNKRVLSQAPAHRVQRYRTPLKKRRMWAAAAPICLRYVQFIHKQPGVLIFFYFSPVLSFKQTGAGEAAWGGCSDTGCWRQQTGSWVRFQNGGVSSMRPTIGTATRITLFIKALEMTDKYVYLNACLLVSVFNKVHWNKSMFT